MKNASGIPKAEIKTSGNAVKVFFYHWFTLLIILYGLLGFLFYLFLFSTNRQTLSLGLSFRGLSKNVLWSWLAVYAVLHLAVFTGGVLVLLYNKVSGFILFIAGMSAILLANAIINHEINYTSWGILLFLSFFLWLWRKHAV
jgi:hypothetical protein